MGYGGELAAGVGARPARFGGVSSSMCWGSMRGQPRN
jgi:hypothetical protein